MNLALKLETGERTQPVRPVTSRTANTTRATMMKPTIFETERLFLMAATGLSIELVHILRFKL